MTCSGYRPNLGVGFGVYGEKHKLVFYGLKKKNKRMRLTERDLKILEHVARYRITTSDILQGLFFAENQPGSVKNVLKRLIKGEYLQSRPLFHKRVYYQLTATSARSIGESGDIANSLGSQALIRTYGVLAFCCRAGTNKPLQKFTRHEFEQAFPSFSNEIDISQSTYYLDQHGDTVRLGQLMIDQGGDYQRLANKCRNDVLSRAIQVPGLREILTEKLFVMTLVVGEESKQKALLTLFQKNPLPVWTRVETVPELIHLIPGSSTSDVVG